MHVLGHAQSTSELAKLIAQRRHQLGISSRHLDQIAGLVDGRSLLLNKPLIRKSAYGFARHIAIASCHVFLLLLTCTWKQLTVV